MRQFLGLAMLLFLSIPLMGVSSCEQKLDSIAGVHVVYDADGKVVMEPDGKTPKVIIDPDSPAAKAINGAGNSSGPLGILLTLGGGLGLTALQTVLKNRLIASTKADLKAEQDAHGETKNTLAATTSGMVSFAKANPTMAPALVDHVDAAQDAHDVDPAHQDAIQSALAPPKI